MSETEKVWLKHYDPGVPASIGHPSLTLPGILEQAAREHPHQPAISFQGDSMPYQDLAELSMRFAAGLNMTGVQSGDRVALFLPNSEHYVVAYFAVLRLGAIVVPNNPLLVQEELLRQLRDCGARAIVTSADKEFLDKVAYAKRAGQADTIIVADTSVPLTATNAARGAQDSPGFYDFADLLHARNVPPDVTVPEADAVLLYTAGTTGVSKGARLSHRNLIANALQCRRWYPSMKSPGEAFLTVLPMFHAFALTTCLNLGVLARGTMVVLPKFDVQDLLETIYRHGPGILIGVPAVYVAIAKHAQPGRQWPVRFGFSAGAALGQTTRDAFEKATGVGLIEGYGLTEASPAVTCNPVNGRQKGIGIPLPDTDCRVVDLDEANRSVPVGSVGELCVKGPQVMQGYYGLQGGQGPIVDGWLHTEDVVRMDADGYFEFLDRKSDVIRVQKTRFLTAYKVFPCEVERVLLAHPGVADAAVVGVPDLEQGEKVLAFVVPRSGSNVSERALAAFCSERMTEYNVPSEFRFVPQIPKDVLGKTLRRKLR
ncbi:MAG: AMP-binding protein [Chloroflexi bacterium]|nr:AMP-binding protein [Chloroflexota bacterium]